MKQIFTNDILQVHPTADGIVFSHKLSTDGERVTVAFSKAVFRTGEFTRIQKNYYLMAKFGSHYKYIEDNIGNYITCQAALLDNGGLICVETDGTARVFDKDGNIVKTAELNYHGEVPASVAVSGRSFWCSYPEDNSIVRYSLLTLREELKLGGRRSGFSSPEGLFIEGKEMFVCNAGSKKLWQVNLSSYAVTEYAELGEPVHGFVRSGENEFVILDSGLYLLELVDL